MARSATHSRGHSRRWILPTVAVLLWIFVGGPLGSFAGQLASVQENDNAAFLPETAESTLAAEEYAKFIGSESVPTIVVFERAGGLTGEDQAASADLLDEVRTVENVDSEAVFGPIPSEDGTAAQAVVPLATSDGEELEQAVVDIREVLDSGAPDGLTALVGGPGGVLGDFIEAFGAIDGLLLLVALTVVLVILLVVLALALSNDESTRRKQLAWVQAVLETSRWTPTRLAREDNLLRRSRGRMGTVLTGLGGILSQAAAPMPNLIFVFSTPMRKQKSLTKTGNI